MKALLGTTSLCLFCAGLICLLSGPAGAEAVPSVLSRVQQVDDPELAELIRVTMERTGRSPDLIRAVTESYAQIRLLDRQIEQLELRIASIRGPEEVLQELRLAKVELESKRMIELAKLREVMGIIPRHALGRRPVQELKTWLALDVLGDRVYVLEHKQPFSGRGDERSYTPIGLWPEQQVLDDVAKRLARKDGLPIRVDIERTGDGVGLSQSLERGVIESIKGAGLLMDAEVHLDDVARQGHQEYRIMLKQSAVIMGSHEIAMMKMRGIYGDADTLMMRGGAEERDGLTDANAVRQNVREVLTGPGRLPARFIIEHDAVNRDLAGEVVAAVNAIAGELGLADFVQVTRTLLPPDPEERYLGRWQAVHEGEAIEINFLPRRRCSIIVDGRPNMATWAPAGDEIVMTASDWKCKGRIDDDGNLVINKDGERIVCNRAE